MNLFNIRNKLHIGKLMKSHCRGRNKSLTFLLVCRKTEKADLNLTVLTLSGVCRVYTINSTYQLSGRYSQASGKNMLYVGSFTCKMYYNKLTYLYNIDRRLEQLVKGISRVSWLRWTFCIIVTWSRAWLLQPVTGAILALSYLYDLKNSRLRSEPAHAT